MYDGTLATKGPWQALVTMQQMIVLADQDGFVDMTPEAISRRTSIPLEIITEGIAALLEPDPRSRTPDEDGRRIVPIEGHRDWGWKLVNHAKYQQIRKAEERREYLRVAQAKHRAKTKNQGAVNTVNTASTKSTLSTPPDPDTDPYPDAEKKRARKRVSRPEDVAEQVWSDWLQLRKDKKAPVTQTVVEGAIAEAAKAGMTLEQFLRVWCTRGSQGLKAEWLTRQEWPSSNRGNDEPEWRREQRERTEAFAGPAAAKRRGSTTIIDMEPGDAFTRLVG